MKCWLMRIAMFLILGALTTVAVAWTFSCLPHFKARARWTGSVDGVGCYSEQLANAGSTWLIIDEVIPSPHLATRPELAERILALEMSLMALTFTPHQKGVDPSCTPVRPRVPALKGAIVVEYRHGWPLRALTCHAVLSPDERPRFFWAATVTKFDEPREILRTRLLPLRPIWDGLLLNTLFFALAWWAVIVGLAPALRNARGFIRKRRGGCPRCGYDQRGQREPGCPECGEGRDM